MTISNRENVAERKMIQRIEPPTDNDPELLNAYDRIGGNSSEVMRWVLSFVHRDLKKISQGDWLNLRYEITAFVRFGPSRIPIDRRRSKIALTEWVSAPAGWADIGSSLAFPQDREIRRMQSYASGQLSSLRDEGFAYFNLGQTKLRVSNLRGLHGNLSPKLDSAWAAFKYHLAFLLADHPKRILKCPECNILFLRERRNQLYCSRTHQNRSASRKYRDTPYDRIGKRGRPPKIQQEPPGNIKSEKRRPIKRSNKHGTKRR
jgi:hypothetical protein